MVSNYHNPRSAYLANTCSMDPDQFDQVVQAIIDGKYSWACVLMLRSAGYNPAHYIPYRTYKRLIKDNRPKSAQGQAPSDSVQAHDGDSAAVRMAG